MFIIFIGYSGGGGGGYSSGPAAIVQKHIYVHVPPPDQDEIRVQRPIPIAAPQKHYKIIFIKAPSPPQYQAPIIPVQPQNEEKTLVYVLVKKPEEQQDIIIPTAAPTQPSKPEVYFIKYKVLYPEKALLFLSNIPLNINFLIYLHLDPKGTRWFLKRWLSWRFLKRWLNWRWIRRIRLRRIRWIKWIWISWRTCWFGRLNWRRRFGRLRNWWRHCTQPTIIIRTTKKISQYYPNSCLVF